MSLYNPAKISTQNINSSTRSISVPYPAKLNSSFPVISSYALNEFEIITKPFNEKTSHIKNRNEFTDIICAFLLSRSVLLLNRTMNSVDIYNYVLVFFTLWRVWQTLIQFDTKQWNFPILSMLATGLNISIYYGLSMSIRTLFNASGSSSIAFFCFVMSSKLINAAYILISLYFFKTKIENVYTQFSSLFIATATYIPLLFISKTIARQYWILPIMVELISSILLNPKITQKYDSLSKYLLIFTLLTCIPIDFSAFTYLSGLLSVLVIYIISQSQSLHIHTQPKPTSSYRIKRKSYIKKLPKILTMQLCLLLTHSASILFTFSLSILVLQINETHSTYSTPLPFSFSPNIQSTLNKRILSTVGSKIPSSLLPKYPEALTQQTLVTSGNSYLIQFDPTFAQGVLAISFFVLLLGSLGVSYVKGVERRVCIFVGMIRVLVCVSVGLVSFLGLSVGVLLFVESGIVLGGLGFEWVFVDRGWGVKKNRNIGIRNSGMNE